MESLQEYNDVIFFLVQKKTIMTKAKAFPNSYAVAGQRETVVTNRPVGLVAGLRSLALTACLYDLITRGAGQCQLRLRPYGSTPVKMWSFPGANVTLVGTIAAKLNTSLP